MFHDSRAMMRVQVRVLHPRRMGARILVWLQKYPAQTTDSSIDHLTVTPSLVGVESILWVVKAPSLQ